MPERFDKIEAGEFTLKYVSGAEKRGFLEGGFCKMHASLGCGALSAKCTAGANILEYFSSLAMTLDTIETPFAKTPFSWFLNVVIIPESGQPVSKV